MQQRDCQPPHTHSPATTEHSAAAAAAAARHQSPSDPRAILLPCLRDRLLPRQRNHEARSHRSTAPVTPFVARHGRRPSAAGGLRGAGAGAEAEARTSACTRAHRCTDPQPVDRSTTRKCTHMARLTPVACVPHSHPRARGQSEAGRRTEQAAPLTRTHHCRPSLPAPQPASATAFAATTSAAGEQRAAERGGCAQAASEAERGGRRHVWRHEGRLLFGQWRRQAHRPRHLHQSSTSHPIHLRCGVHCVRAQQSAHRSAHADNKNTPLTTRSRGRRSGASLVDALTVLSACVVGGVRSSVCSGDCGWCRRRRAARRAVHPASRRAAVVPPPRRGATGTARRCSYRSAHTNPTCSPPQVVSEAVPMLM